MCSVWWIAHNAVNKSCLEVQRGSEAAAANIDGLDGVTEYRFTGSDCGFDSIRYLLQRMNCPAYGTNDYRQVNQMASEFSTRHSGALIFINHAAQQMSCEEPDGGWDKYDMSNIPTDRSAWSNWLELLCKCPGGADADGKVLTNLRTAVRMQTACM